MRKPVIIWILLITGLVLLRGPIFRTLVSYEEVYERPSVALPSEKIRHLINQELDTKDNLSILQIARISQKITRQLLDFSFEKTNSNIAVVIDNGSANCVEYTRLCNAVVNEIIRVQGKTNQIEGKHKVGVIRLLGMNVHQWTDNSFWKDHDYNEIRDLKSGEQIIFDATVNDYFYINTVRKLR